MGREGGGADQVESSRGGGLGVKGEAGEVGDKGSRKRQGQKGVGKKSKGQLKEKGAQREEDVAQYVQAAVHVVEGGGIQRLKDGSLG